MKYGPIIRAFFTAMLLLLQLGFAQAFDDTVLLSAEREATGMRSDLERVQTVLDQEGVTDDQLAEQRSIVEELRLNAVVEVTKINPSLDAVKQQLNQLGPPPTQGQTEAATIATQRRELGDAVSRFTAAKKQCREKFRHNSARSFSNAYSKPINQSSIRSFGGIRQPVRAFCLQDSQASFQSGGKINHQMRSGPDFYFYLP
jgi:hypothetical protein